MTLSIRPANALDERSFVQAEVAGWQHAYQGLLPASYLHGNLHAERVEFWRDRFASSRPHQLLTVAEAQGEVAGVACAFSAIPITLGECCVDQLYVLPLHKRQGVGTRLLAESAAWCEARGSKSLVLSTIEENTDAVAFYTALGGIARVAKSWAPTCGGSLAVLEFVWPEIQVLSRCG